VKNEDKSSPTDAELAAELLGENAGDTIKQAHPLLSEEEVAKIRAEARAKIKAEQLSAAKKALLEEEMAKLRAEAGLTTGDEAKDEMVTITVDLAEHSDRLTLNSVPYWHGHTYTVPRHVADTLREMMYRGWQHQNELDGKSLEQFYQTARLTRISEATGAVTNAPQRAA
jgi:hypothetical protein